MYGTDLEDEGTIDEVIHSWMNNPFSIRHTRTKGGLFRSPVAFNASTALHYKGQLIAHYHENQTLIGGDLSGGARTMVGKVQRALIKARKPYAIVPKPHAKTQVIIDGTALVQGRRWVENAEHRGKTVEYGVGIRTRQRNLRFLIASVHRHRTMLVSRRTKLGDVGRKAWLYQWWLNAAAKYASMAYLPITTIEFEEIDEYLYRHNAVLYANIVLDDPKMNVLRPRAGIAPNT